MDYTGFRTVTRIDEQDDSNISSPTSGDVLRFNGSKWANSSQAASGFSGYSGLSGFSGYSGAGGSNGASGFSGYSGFSGIGTSGFSGYSGYSGGSGYSGYSGYSGGNRGVITLASATDAIDATLGNTVIISTAANFTVATISNGTNAQTMTLRIKNTAGADKTVTYGTTVRTDDGSTTFTAKAGKTHYVGLLYNSADSKWDLVAAPSATGV